MGYQLRCRLWVPQLQWQLITPTLAPTKATGNTSKDFMTYMYWHCISPDRPTRCLSSLFIRHAQFNTSVNTFQWTERQEVSYTKYLVLWIYEFLWSSASSREIRHLVLIKRSTHSPESSHVNQSRPNVNVNVIQVYYQHKNWNTWLHKYSAPPTLFSECLCLGPKHAI